MGARIGIQMGLGGLFGVEDRKCLQWPMMCEYDRLFSIGAVTDDIIIYGKDDPWIPHQEHEVSSVFSS